MRKTVPFIIKLILAYTTTVAIAGVSGYGITGIEIMLPCIFALTLLVYHKAYERIVKGMEEQERKYLKRDIWCSLPVGILLSAGITVGSHYDIWNQVITSMGGKDLLYFVFIAVFLTAAVLLLFGIIDKKSADRDNLTQKKTTDVVEKSEFGKKQYFITVLVMLICWLPYYLTMLPGNIGSDTIEEINMCLGNIPWTNHHPVFYTMLIGVFVGLGRASSLTLAMSLFSAFQMILLAFTLAYVIKWMWRRFGADKRAGRKCIVALILFALHPAVAMFSIYLSKDVLFSCALVMLSLSLYDLVCAEKREYIQVAVWSFFTMLLRNNGLMIVAIIGILLLIIHKADFKKILPAIGGAILLFVIFRACAFGIFDVSPQSFAESAAIPLQQTGYVIANTRDDKVQGLSDEENNLLQSIMPYDRVREVYQLGYVDPVKFDDAFDDAYFNEHAADYMKIWLRLLPTHLSEYVKAYLAETAGYWHYGETNTLCTQGVTDNALGIERIDIISDITGFSLYGIIEKLMFVVRKAPVLCILTSMAMQFYMIVLLLCLYIRTKRNSQILALMPAMLLWLSIMIATPAFCLFRYTFAMFLLWPVFADELLG